MNKLTDFYQKSYLKSAEVAQLFNVNHSTVFLWVKKGKLRPLRTPGRNYRFSHDEVRKILDERISRRSINKRNTPRFKVEYPVAVTTSLQSDQSFDASITGISSHGFSLSVSDDGTMLRQLERGEVTTVHIFNRQHSFLRDVIEGSVRHFKKVDDMTIAVGLRILNQRGR